MTRLIKLLVMLGVIYNYLFTLDLKSLQISTITPQKTFLWSEPVNVSSTTNGAGEELAITMGKDGAVHVIWNVTPNVRQNPELANEPSSLYYSVLHNNIWSTPIDIVLTQGSASYPRIAIDFMGTLHVIYQGNGCLSYTSSVLPETQQVRKWEFPTCLEGPTVSQDLIIDQFNTLHIVYVTPNNFLFYKSSHDQGHTWSLPTVISTGIDERFLHMPAIAIDNLKGLHVVWSENQLPDGYPPLGIYYSSSFDEGKSWSIPVILQDGFAAEPAIITDGDNIHAIWGSALAWAKRFYKYSPSHGQFWNETVELVGGGGGLLWQPTLAVDSTNTIHVVTNEDEGAFYIYNQAGVWSKPTTIYKYPIAHARMVLGLGNQLHLIFRDQRDQSVQYMYLELAILQTPSENYTLPIKNITNTPTLLETQATSLETLPLNHSNIDTSNQSGKTSPFFPLMISSSLSLIIIVIAIKYKKVG